MRGRPPLPPEQRRDVVLKMRVKRSAAQRFSQECAARGLNQSEAMRQAINLWIRSGGRK